MHKERIFAYQTLRLNMIKWIGAVLGWFVGGRFIGAFIGYIAGSLIDNLFTSNTGRSGGFRTVFENTTRQTVSPGDFELNLLSLASIVIKADDR